MLASTEADSLRGSFRPHLPWTRNNRNHRPGKSISSLSDAFKSLMKSMLIGLFSHFFPIHFANNGETRAMQARLGYWRMGREQSSASNRGQRGKWER